MDPLELNEPEKVGDFIVGKTMGRGTFGKVKLGTHTSTNEKVAIKILDKQKIKDQSDLERINREIKILKKLRHPHVVQLFQIIENERYLYLIMEYCSGDQIMKHIKKNGRLKESEASRFYQQIISAVEYIHRLGIVHRDIKPENILLDHNNNVKVVDFGLGNLYVYGNMLKTACGSPCYAAPEMTKGLPYHGIMTDIWSSGVVLFVMVTGSLPFQDRNTNKLYQKIQSADYKLPDFLSDTCKDFIKRILVPDWNLRYRIEDIRAHPFYHLIQPSEKDGIIIDKNFQIPFDDKILTKMEKDYKANVETAKQELKANRFTANTTIYYLLLKRHERVGLLRQQFQLDLNSKSKKVVNVQMVLNQQQQQQAKLEQNQNQGQVQEDSSASPPLKAQLNQQPSQSIQQNNLQETAAAAKRQDHSTDVRGGGNNIQMAMRGANYMSTINPEVIVQQPQQHVQAQYFNQTTMVDPFSKVNNPKARKLIETSEKQKTGGAAATRHDSTGGSGEYGEFISYHQQQVQNARNLPGANNLNIMLFQQSTGGPEHIDAVNDSITKQSRGQAVAQQPQLQNNSSQLVTTGVNAARQQLPSPSYQNYLFSEKLTPSHYRSPLPGGNNQMFTQAPSMDQYVKIPATTGTKQQAKLNTSNIKQQQNQVIANIISSTTNSSAQKKYRSASRSNNEQQIHLNASPKIVKKPALATGVVTPSLYGRVKHPTNALQSANTTQIINNPQQLLNQSFQENPQMMLGKQRINTGGESLDMDMYVASPNLVFGKTSIGFGTAKNNTRVGTQLGGRVTVHQGSQNKNGDYNMQQPNTVRTSSQNYNAAPTPPGQGNHLNFQLNPNNTIIIRNPQSNQTPVHHVRHNSYNGNGQQAQSPVVQQRQKALVNINQMLNTGGGANGAIGFKKFLNQTQDNQQRASITPEEVALYVSATNAQQIINGKRSINSKKQSQQKNSSLNQTFY